MIYTYHMYTLVTEGIYISVIYTDDIYIYHMYTLVTEGHIYTITYQ